MLSDACAMCIGMSVELKICAGCENVLYCSQRCHAIGWPQHKVTCKGGNSKTLPCLIDSKGEFVGADFNFGRIKRDYLCDPAEEYELFTSFDAHLKPLNPDQTKGKQEANKQNQTRKRTFKAPPVNNRYSGKKKGQKNKKK